MHDDVQPPVFLVWSFRGCSLPLIVGTLRLIWLKWYDREKVPIQAIALKIKLGSGAMASSTTVGEAQAHELPGGPPVPDSESDEPMSVKAQLANVMNMLKDQAAEMARFKKELEKKHKKELEKQEQEIAELNKKFQEHMESKPNEKDEDKLKPIDVKDIKKPTEYDGKVDEFTAWYESLKDLLTNRHPSWAKVVKVIEDKKDKRIINAIDEIFGDLDEKVKGQADVYMQQLQAYLRTYTKSSLLNMVNKTKPEEAPEILRDIIQKGKSYNKNKVVSLKAQIYAPPRATKTEDLEKILTEWKHNTDLVEKGGSDVRHDG